jgi:hypothetical protein
MKIMFGTFQTLLSHRFFKRTKNIKLPNKIPI